MSSEEISHRSEEGRVLVGLGLLAIAVPYRDHLPKDFAFPIPYPVPHLQVFTVPIFDFSVVFYSLYAVCMGFYFSEDVSWLSLRIRKEWQRLGHAIGVGHTFSLFWYLFTALGWALVPVDLGLTYGLLSNLSLLYVVALITDILTGNWGRTNRLIARIVRSYYRSFQPAEITLLTRLWKRFDTKLPKEMTSLFIHLRRILRRKYNR